jgi:hypothetical protein
VAINSVRVCEGLGAGDGIRTRDGLLGRQVLYQPELLPLDGTHCSFWTGHRQKAPLSTDEPWEATRRRHWMHRSALASMCVLPQQQLLWYILHRLSEYRSSDSRTMAWQGADRDRSVTMQDES